MGRLREKVLPSLRAALDKLEENAETIPHEDSPHFLPRWDFSQSQEGYLTLFKEVNTIVFNSTHLHLYKLCSIIMHDKIN